MAAVALAACHGGAPPLPQSADSPVATPAALGNGTVRDTAGGYAARLFAPIGASGRAAAALNVAIVLGQGDTGAVQPFLEYAMAAGDGETRLSATYLLSKELTPGSPEAAARLLKPFASAARDAPITPYLVAAYASALDAAGDHGEAAKQWEALLKLPPPPKTLAATAYRSLASATSGSARLAWLGKLAATIDDADDRLQFGIAARASGDAATFAQQLTRVIQDDPGTHAATLAVQAFKAAGLAVDPGDEGLVDYRHSDDAAAVRVLAPAVGAPGETAEEQTFRLYYLAAAYEDQGKLGNAIAAYDLAATTGADSTFVQRAKYWAATVAEKTGDVTAASTRYVSLIKDGPSGEFSEEAAFQAGDVFLRSGDPRAALTAWESIGPTEDARVLYWKGRTASTLGLTDEATQAFEAAARADPFDFYGIEAQAAVTGDTPAVAYRARGLTTSIDWDEVSAWLAKRAGAGSIPDHRTAAAQLAAMGLRDDARQALTDASDGADPWQLLGLVKEARDAGLSDASSTLMGQLVAKVGAKDAELPKAALRLEYPLTYVESLDADGRANGVDPLFLAAVVYQESLWNPEAGSSAGAIGLMQLIATTGAAVGKEAGIEDVTAADLFQPTLNLQLGARFLGAQLTQFGNPALALAAYNAGPGNAARWQADWDGMDAATLVATMDFNETTDYVISIYEWYARYQAAYG